METIGNIASFESMGLVDGPGVRFVVFMQGCPLRCAYCHNPEMWNLNETKYQMTPSQLLSKVKKYVPYFKDEGGVTVSGGEPLMQAQFVEGFFKLCKENNIHTCLDTSGACENFGNILNYCDLVILDVKATDTQKYQELTGKSINLFNRFLKQCKEKNVKLWLRQVIVPGFNDSEENILRLKEFAKDINNVEKIELLPYHTMAISKYKNLGIKYRLDGVSEMNKEKCKKLEMLLRE